MGLWNAVPHFWKELSSADRINFTIALCTAIAAIAAAYSAWMARRSIRGTLEEFRAQAFLGVLTYEREVDFSAHMNVIRGLQGRPAKEMTEDERSSILVVVNFLNHIAHLIRHCYVVPKQMLLLYAPSIAACRDNLLQDGQWLRELRKQTGEARYYLHFAKLCQRETEDLIWRDRAAKIIWTTDPYEPPLPPI